MQTAEQVFDMMKHLPDEELERLKVRFDELLREKKSNPPPKRGERIRALAGRFNLGECLKPDWDRAMLYEED